MTEGATTDVATDQPRSWFAFFLRPDFLLAVTPFLILFIAALTYRSTRFVGIPPIDEIVDHKAEGRIDINPEENAFTYYERACKGLPATIDDEAPDEVVEQIVSGCDWNDVPPNLRSSLGDCETALNEWLFGTNLENCGRIESAPEDAHECDRTENLCYIFCLALLKSSRLMHEGRSDESWRWIRATLRFSRHMNHSQIGSLQNLDVGSFMIANQQAACWASHIQVSEAQIQTAIDECRRIYASTRKMSHRLRGCYRDSIKRLSSSEELKELHEPTFPELPESLNGVDLFLNGEPQLAELLLRHVYANYVSQCDLPRQDRVMATTSISLFAPTGRESPPLMDVNALNDALARSQAASTLLDYHWHPDLADYELASCNALELCLNVELFRRRHGDYPRSLKDLVPEFIDQVPHDVFGTSPADLMMMVRTDAEEPDSESDDDESGSVPKIVIYSRGPDGVDDTGDIDFWNDWGVAIPLMTEEN